MKTVGKAGASFSYADQSSLRNTSTARLISGVLSYTSGTNRLCDIRGAVAAQVPIGVDISRLSASAEALIRASSVPMFLDSGAFSEVSVQGGLLSIARPISDTQWHSRLDKYLRLTRALCGKKKRAKGYSRVTIVAPDCVGNQELTLQRLLRFRDRVRQIHAAGADVIVPMQTGRLNIIDFYKKAKSILNFEIVAGIPMNKAPMSVTAIQNLLRHMQPQRIHLLGMGPDNRRSVRVIQFIREVSRCILISMDANRIRAGVGENRPITRAERQYRDDVMSSWTGEVDLSDWGGDVHDFTELLFQPSLWLSPTKLKQFAESLTWLTRRQKREFMRAPDEFVSGETNSNDWIYQSLTRAYFQYVQAETRRAARSKAVCGMLRDDTALQHSRPRPHSTTWSRS